MKSLFLFFSILLVAATVFAQQSSSPAKAAKQPRAKTQAESADYKTAVAVTGGAAMESAADNFAAKYPDSELRENLYFRALHEYQVENQPTKVLAMGRTVLALNPENSTVLVLTATVLADQLPDAATAQSDDQLIETKRDDKAVEEIRKNAGLALQTIDSSFVPPVQVTPEQLAAYKSSLKAMAHSALGITDLKLGDNPGAETELKAAIDLGKARPDPYNYYQLALAQDRQKKYAEALASAKEGLRYAGEDPGMTKMLEQERDKMTQQTSATPPAK